MKEETWKKGRKNKREREIGGGRKERDIGEGGKRERDRGGGEIGGGRK